MSRNSREDVIAAAGRLFADRGYGGTSMRDLGKELGLFGSSLYSHVGSKQDLLVEVVRRGAGLFEASAACALSLVAETGAERLRVLIAGHLDVVLDHRDEVRTFLNEAKSLDAGHRAAIVDARNQYEHAFRSVLKDGIADGSFRADLDPALVAIFLLSILNAVDRWFSEAGRISRAQLVDEILGFAALSPRLRRDTP